jgi:hypothetical protein
MSSNFTVFLYLPFPACFVLHRSGSGTKQAGKGERERTEPGGRGRARVKERFVPKGVGFGLGRNRRGPKRLSEPRPSGVDPVQGAVMEDAQLALRAHLQSANCRFFVQIVVDGIS